MTTMELGHSPEMERVEQLTPQEQSIAFFSGINEAMQDGQAVRAEGVLQEYDEQGYNLGYPRMRRTSQITKGFEVRRVSDRLFTVGIKYGDDMGRVTTRSPFFEGTYTVLDGNVISGVSCDISTASMGGAIKWERPVHLSHETGELSPRETDLMTAMIEEVQAGRMPMTSPFEPKTARFFDSGFRTQSYLDGRVPDTTA